MEKQRDHSYLEILKILRTSHSEETRQATIESELVFELGEANTRPRWHLLESHAFVPTDKGLTSVETVPEKRNRAHLEQDKEEEVCVCACVFRLFGLIALP